MLLTLCRHIASAPQRLLTLCCGLAAALSPVTLSWASATPPAPTASVARAQTGGVVRGNSAWQNLTPTQRDILAPLASQWVLLDETSQEKWLQVAAAYPRLSAPEQQRLRARMSQWAALPPGKRGEVRLRFQQSRQISASERQRQWQAYQSLSAEERAVLARRAQRRMHTVYLADTMPGPREAGQVYSSKHSAIALQRRHEPTSRRAAAAAVAPPVAVAPTLVRPGAGATTNLVTQQPVAPWRTHAPAPVAHAASRSSAAAQAPPPPPSQSAPAPVPSSGGSGPSAGLGSNESYANP